AGEATQFLPFNRGSEDGGVGNPLNPGGHRTAYLWEKVWEREAWLDLLPRFHQWDAVRRLEAAAREDGAGRSYLVEHSAGSGKSNSIAWLAHRLSSLHDAAD